MDSTSEEDWKEIERSTSMSLSAGGLNQLVYLSVSPAKKVGNYDKLTVISDYVKHQTWTALLNRSPNIAGSRDQDFQILAGSLIIAGSPIMAGSLIMTCLVRCVPCLCGRLPAPPDHLAPRAIALLAHPQFRAWMADQASNISCANDQEYDEGGTSTGKEVEKPLSWENCIGNLAAKKELEQAVFFNIRGSDIKSEWYGRSENFIKNIFSKAREHPLSIIFIDEIDSVGGARHGSESRASDGTLTELLQEMNVVSDRSCVVVIGATNCPSKLDKALLRRLEKKIHITLPDADTRENLIKYYLEDTLHTLVLADFKKLASLTEGSWTLAPRTTSFDVKKWMGVGVDGEGGGGGFINADFCSSIFSTMAWVKNSKLWWNTHQGWRFLEPRRPVLEVLLSLKSRSDYRSH
ncbi:Vacuolar protein sorting-associated protein 4B [Folsomia candida]|uniref:Vacuolar protein sorting-associated protein 4B n=1 Tax=Folsomia candida TaxID=158441 RepID=A0A226DVN1_FOLCA|nr:Vacuolar protein sorting-associated protein 4B [Folsomia candida]